MTTQRQIQSTPNLSRRTDYTDVEVRINGYRYKIHYKIRTHIYILDIHAWIVCRNRYSAPRWGLSQWRSAAPRGKARSSRSAMRGTPRLECWDSEMRMGLPNALNPGTYFKKKHDAIRESRQTPSILVIIPKTSIGCCKWLRDVDMCEHIWFRENKAQWIWVTLPAPMATRKCLEPLAHSHTTNHCGLYDPGTTPNTQLQLTHGGKKLPT